MEIGGEAEQLQGIGDAAHIPIYTRQPGMRADMGEGRSIYFFTLCLFQQPYYSTMLPVPKYLPPVPKSHDDLSPPSLL